MNILGIVWGWINYTKSILLLSWAVFRIVTVSSIVIGIANAQDWGCFSHPHRWLIDRPLHKFAWPSWNWPIAGTVVKSDPKVRRSLKSIWNILTIGNWCRYSICILAIHRCKTSSFIMLRFSYLRYTAQSLRWICRQHWINLFLAPKVSNLITGDIY